MSCARMHACTLGTCSPSDEIGVEALQLPGNVWAAHLCCMCVRMHQPRIAHSWILPEPSWIITCFYELAYFYMGSRVARGNVKRWCYQGTEFVAKVNWLTNYNSMLIVQMCCCPMQGLLSMANSGADTNTSHFSILMSPAPHLDGHYTIFGEVVEGFEVRLQSRAWHVWMLDHY